MSIIYKTEYMSRSSFSSNVHYNLGNNKPLINREQTFVLDRKILTVHSEDRDVTKWPNANKFEIMLPEQIQNVQSMRLVQSTFPGKYYTFTNNYQNTKMLFTIDETLYEITIQEGYYTACQLALEITNKMNKAIGVDASFNVFYDEVAQKFWFGHTDLPFTLNFATQITYSITNCEQPIVWNQYANWGLPYNLGFQKQNYPSQTDLDGISFDYLCPSSVTCSGSATPAAIRYYVEAPLSFNIIGDLCIYMEVDKYNSMDELYPYNQSSRSLYDNNAYNGQVEAAFAKIPIQGHETWSFDARTLFLQNIVHYDPPIERIARLKFKFRFHDGRLVDFQNYNFDFCIEFNCLRDEIAKAYEVRIPATYIL